MGKKGHKKQLLAEYRRWQSYCVTTWIAIVAFAVTQYDRINNVLLWLSGISAIILLLFIMILALKIKKSIDEIRKL